SSPTSIAIDVAPRGTAAGDRDRASTSWPWSTRCAVSARPMNPEAPPMATIMVTRFCCVPPPSHQLDTSAPSRRNFESGGLRLMVGPGISAGDQRRGPACTDKSSPPCFRGTPHLRERQETTLAQAVVHYQRRVPVVTAEADQQRAAVPCRMSMLRPKNGERKPSPSSLVPSRTRTRYRASKSMRRSVVPARASPWASAIGVKNDPRYFAAPSGAHSQASKLTSPDGRPLPEKTIHSAGFDGEPCSTLSKLSTPEPWPIETRTVASSTRVARAPPAENNADCEPGHATPRRPHR